MNMTHTKANAFDAKLHGAQGRVFECRVDGILYEVYGANGFSYAREKKVGGDYFRMTRDTFIYHFLTGYKSFNQIKKDEC